MFRLATSTSRKSTKRGSALIITLVVMVSLVGLLFAASSMSTIEVKQSRRMVNEVRSDYLAQAGVERGINFLSAAVANSTMAAPLGGLTNLFAGGPTFSPFVGTQLMNGTERVGAYSVTLTNVAQTATSITIAIDKRRAEIVVEVASSRCAQPARGVRRLPDLRARRTGHRGHRLGHLPRPARVPT